MRLLKCEEPVTMKTDWFEMREARLHLAPYTDPHFEIAVASTITPFGMIAAGTHGVGVLSIGAGLPGGPEALADPVEDRRRRRCQSRQDDRPQELARGRERAPRRGRRAGAARSGERRADRDRDLFRGHPGPPARPRRTTRCARAWRWAPRWSARRRRWSRASAACSTTARAVSAASCSAPMNGPTASRSLRSYELFARYVMPQFQGSLDTIVGSNAWARENRKQVFGGTVEAVKRAFTDFGARRAGGVSLPHDRRARRLKHGGGGRSGPRVRSPLARCTNSQYQSLMQRTTEKR